MQYNYRYLWYWWYLSVLNFCMLYIIVTELTPTLGTGEKIIKYQKKYIFKNFGRNLVIMFLFVSSWSFWGAQRTWNKKILYYLKSYLKKSRLKLGQQFLPHLATKNSYKTHIFHKNVEKVCATCRTNRSLSDRLKKSNKDFQVFAYSFWTWNLHFFWNWLI